MCLGHRRHLYDHVPILSIASTGLNWFTIHATSTNLQTACHTTSLHGTLLASGHTACSAALVCTVGCDHTHTSTHTAVGLTTRLYVLTAGHTIDRHTRTAHQRHGPLAALRSIHSGAGCISIVAAQFLLCPHFFVVPLWQGTIGKCRAQ